MVLGFQNEDTGFISFVCYIAIVYALINDLLIFGEHLGTMELLGSALVLFMTFTVGMYRYLKSQEGNLSASQIDQQEDFRSSSN